MGHIFACVKRNGCAAAWLAGTRARRRPRSYAELVAADAALPDGRDLDASVMPGVWEGLEGTAAPELVAHVRSTHPCAIWRVVEQQPHSIGWRRRWWEIF